MAEENTNDSTPTTETTTEQTALPETTDTSTTQDQAPEDKSTLLTPKEDEAPAPTDEEKAAEEARSALYGAPEEYEVSGLPEGMSIDKEALDLVTPIAKELNLSNEGFNKLTGVYANDILPKVTQQVVDSLEGDIRETQTQWAAQAEESVRTDPVFESKPMAQVQQVAAKALDKFGGTEFREFLQTTGLGNHPAMVKMAYLVGSTISEDTTFERGGATDTPKSRTDKYYGSTS